MRIPILTYQSMHIDGNEYGANDLKALAADIRHLTDAGLRIVPLHTVVAAWLDGRGGDLEGNLVALTCDDGSDFDFVDLPHPTAGTQRSAFNVLRDFIAENPGKQEEINITSFVVASPAARAALDSICMIGQGWWSDAWWAPATRSGLMHIGNHSWDHHHELLPASFSQGVRRGTFSTIGSKELADYEIKQAAEFLHERAPNPGVELFAYPYGESNPYLVREYFPRHGDELGIRAAFTDRAGYLEPGCNRWQIPRFVCGRDWRSPAELQAILDPVIDRRRAWVPARRPTGKVMSPPKEAASPPIPPPEARPARKISGVEVTFSSPGRETTSRGLAPVYFGFEGAQPRFGPAYKLTLAADTSALRFSRSIDLTQGRTKLATFFNTHLLPNGRTRIQASLTQGGVRKVWSDSFVLDVSNAGPLADTVRASLRAYGTPLVLDGLIDSAAYDIANPSLRPWFDRPDAFAHLSELRRAGGISAEEQTALRQFVEDGYVVLPVPVEDALLRTINRELDDAVDKKIEGYEYGTSQRIQNLHLRYPGVRALWQHPYTMRFLQLIFEVPPRACQTLTYIFGSQQGAHQDTIHLTPFPAGFMCGVWVALEEVRPGSGELEIYRGSHRLPRVYMNGSGCAKVTNDDWAQFGDTIAARWREMLEEAEFEKITYRPKPGTILIWHENLMHAGGVRADHSLSRRSIVSHYFADGAIAFYDSTGMPGYME